MCVCVCGERKGFRDGGGGEVKDWERKGEAELGRRMGGEEEEKRRVGGRGEELD